MGKLARSTMSRDMTHVPKAVRNFYKLKDGDILEWWSTERDIPFPEEDVIGIRVRRMSE